MSPDDLLAELARNFIKLTLFTVLSLHLYRTGGGLAPNAWSLAAIKQTAAMAINFASAL